MTPGDRFCLPGTGARFTVLEASPDGSQAIIAGDRTGGRMLATADPGRVFTARQVTDNGQPGSLLETLTPHGPRYALLKEPPMPETLTAGDLAFLADTARRALTHPTFIDPRVAAEAVPVCEELAARCSARAALTGPERTDAYGLLEVGVQEGGFYSANELDQAHALMGKLGRIGLG
jgi:hypothetical protein